MDANPEARKYTVPEHLRMSTRGTVHVVAEHERTVPENRKARRASRAGKGKARAAVEAVRSFEARQTDTPAAGAPSEFATAEDVAARLGCGLAVAVVLLELGGKIDALHRASRALVASTNALGEASETAIEELRDYTGEIARAHNAIAGKLLPMLERRVSDLEARAGSTVPEGRLAALEAWAGTAPVADLERRLTALEADPARLLGPDGLLDLAGGLEKRVAAIEAGLRAFGKGLPE